MNLPIIIIIIFRTSQSFWTLDNNQLPRSLNAILDLVGNMEDKL